MSQDESGGKCQSDGALYLRGDLLGSREKWACAVVTGRVCDGRGVKLEEEPDRIDTDLYWLMVLYPSSLQQCISASFLF